MTNFGFYFFVYIRVHLPQVWFSFKIELRSRNWFVLKIGQDYRFQQNYNNKNVLIDIHKNN